jgi:hypothetical protein
VLSSFCTGIDLKAFLREPVVAGHLNADEGCRSHKVVGAPRLRTNYLNPRARISADPTTASIYASKRVDSANQDEAPAR